MSERQPSYAESPPSRKRPSPEFRDDLIASIPSLRAFAVSLCGDIDRAGDLVQETLVKAWRHSDSFQQGTNIKAWLFRILRNTYFSERRKRAREIQDVDNGFSMRLAVHPEQPGHMDAVDFTAAFKLLSPEQREALTLVGAAGFTYEEVARISGCEVGTVKSRVNRARVRLTELLHIKGAAEFGPDATAEAVLDRKPRGGHGTS